MTEPLKQIRRNVAPPPSGVLDGPAAAAPPAPPDIDAFGRTASMTINGEVAPAFQPGFVRRPFGSLEQKLAAPHRPGFRRYWFNDDPQKPGRIDEAYAAGYTHVLDASGKPRSRIVGRGGIRGYLMECPEEFWKADMAAQERHNQKVEAAIKGDNIGRKAGDRRYTPEDAGNSITEATE